MIKTKSRKREMSVREALDNHNKSVKGENTSGVQCKINDPVIFFTGEKSAAS